jgi:hypothetical protein
MYASLKGWAATVTVLLKGGADLHTRVTVAPLLPVPLHSLLSASVILIFEYTLRSPRMIHRVGGGVK